MSKELTDNEKRLLVESVEHTIGQGTWLNAADIVVAAALISRGLITATDIDDIDDGGIKLDATVAGLELALQLGLVVPASTYAHWRRGYTTPLSIQ